MHWAGPPCRQAASYCVRVRRSNALKKRNRGNWTNGTSKPKSEISNWTVEVARACRSNLRFRISDLRFPFVQFPRFLSLTRKRGGLHFRSYLLCDGFSAADRVFHGVIVPLSVTSGGMDVAGFKIADEVLKMSLPVLIENDVGDLISRSSRVRMRSPVRRMPQRLKSSRERA